MLKNAVVVIPDISDEKQVCDFLAQTAEVLRKNNFVYVLNYFAVPKILPFRRFAVIDHLNRIIYLLFFQVYLIFKHRGAKAFYWWLFFPQLSLLSKIKLPTWQLIYDIVDYHFSPLKSEQKQLEKHKDKLLQKADYIFSNSHTLKKLYQSRSSREIVIVPQGFAMQDFVNGEISQLKLPSGKPILGFTGQISQRLDLKLIAELISANPAWNFVFIGPVHHEPNVAVVLDKQLLDKITKYKNVFYFPAQKRKVLLSIIKQFDICMIPYDVSYNFNRYCYPMKLFEYFYVGKPVVSTRIKELENFPDLVLIGQDARSWQKHIEHLLQEKWPKNKIAKQRESALHNSWKSKLEKMSSYL